MRLTIGKRLFLGFLLLLLLEIGIVGLGVVNIHRLSLLNQQSLGLILPMERVYGLLLSFGKLIMPANDYLGHGNIVEKEVFKLQSEQVEKDIARLKEVFSEGALPEFIQIAEESYRHLKDMAGKIFYLENPIGNIAGGMLMEEMDAFLEKATLALEEYHEKYLDRQLDVLKRQGAQIVKVSMFFFLCFSFFGLALSFVLNYFLAQRIRNPIVTLKKACKRLTSGEMNEKIEINTRDELEELASAFNQMAQDIREHEDKIKQANEELAKWGRHLEERVEERTRELKLAQAQLVQSAKMAAVGQLSGGIAHEINNPLTGVLNNVQLIKMEAEAKKDFNLAEFKQILDAVEESALRCKRITQGLLDFSRAGKRPHQPTNINEAIEDTLILAESEIRIENIKLIRELSNEPPMVLADAHQLQQVFLDIINNAKWAMQEKKQGELRIKTQLRPEHKSVMISFSDTGYGITPENLSHIFEPFFTTKKPGEGTGLGLSICYGIIKEHSGTIEVESEGRDKGATFRITLPAIT